jgi:flagellar protein FlgJ
MTTGTRIDQYTDMHGLAALRREARAQDPAALREAARQFEAVFTRMMLESMRDASGGDPMFDSEESRFYRDMFDDQLAVEMSRGRGLGLAEALVAQVMRSGLASSDANVTPGATGSGRPAENMPRTPLPIPTGARADVPSVERVAPAPDRSAGQGAAAPPAAPDRSAASTTAISAEQRPMPVGRAPTRQEFLDAILPAAEKAAAQLGVSPRNLIAQAALETGWGRSLPRSADGRISFNFFGIKATGGWRGDSVASSTVEVLEGRAQRMVERFRAYSSIDESVADHARLLGHSRRYAAVRGTGDDAHAFGTALQRGGYATDPGYARKIVQVADSVGRLMETRRAVPVAAPQPERTLKVDAQRPLTVADLRKAPDRT